MQEYKFGTGMSGLPESRSSGPKSNWENLAAPLAGKEAKNPSILFGKYNRVSAQCVSQPLPLRDGGKGGHLHFRTFPKFLLFLIWKTSLSDFLAITPNN